MRRLFHRPIFFIRTFLDLLLYRLFLNCLLSGIIYRSHSLFRAVCCTFQGPIILVSHTTLELGFYI